MVAVSVKDEGLAAESAAHPQLVNWNDRGTMLAIEVHGWLEVGAIAQDCCIVERFAIQLK